jgi:D-glycero-alpha-D-manno-heptose-7-phosphate kinase
MVIRSKAPLRLGLAGGGTDVAQYSDIYGGNVLNVTINMFAYCTLEPLANDDIEFIALDIKNRFNTKTMFTPIQLGGGLDLHKAIYNRIVRDYNNGQPLAVRVTTHSDAPPGSGLGSSSTMVVAILSAYCEWLNLPLGEYDIARLAYDIERVDCNLAGGKQDQYAATFGGFNFMEFGTNGSVIVNPLRVKPAIEAELEQRMILFFTGKSRDSAKIIDDQIKDSSNQDSKSLNAMHQTKAMSLDMKNFILQGKLTDFVRMFADMWEIKKQFASSISNDHIDTVAEAVLQNGAEAVKISGAGGGGFMMIFVDPLRRLDVMQTLAQFEGEAHKCQFYHNGVTTWRVQ